MKSRLTPIGSFAFVLAVATGLIGSPSRADTTLRWKFAEGSTYNYTATEKTITKTKIMGQDVNQTQAVTFDISRKVKSIAADGTADVVQTLERIKFSVDSPLLKFEFDSKSDKDPDGPLAAQFAAQLRVMANKPFEMKITSRGEIKDVKLPQAVLDSIKNSGGAGGLLSEDALKTMSSQGTLVFPEEALAANKTWTSKTTQPNTPIGSVEMDNMYTYNGPKNGAESISLDMKMQIKPLDNSPIQVKLGDQDNKGQFLFDNTAGRLKSSTLTQKRKMTVSANGMEFEQDVESTTTMELAPGN